LISKPIEYYTCFISYSSKDEIFAKRLFADLQDKGVRCWFAPEDLKIGTNFRSRIDEAIRVYDKLLLILSRYSTRSAWVESEVESALEKERKEKRIILIPIRLDKAIMETKAGWPALIRKTRHIADFEQWKAHDKYQTAFSRLIRDLTLSWATEANELREPTDGK
jgi:TIR domain